MNDNEAVVRIVGDASGVTLAVRQTEGEIAGLGPALAQLTAGFAELAAEIRASMATTAVATEELVQEMHHLEVETEKESLSLKELALTAKEGAESIVMMREAAMGFAEVFMAAFLVEQIAEWSKEFAEAAEKVKHLGEQFGMTSQQVQGLGVVAKLSGISIETITKGLGILDKNLFSGSKDSIFKQMGIDAKDSKDQVELLAKVADKFKDMDDGPKKAALAMDLFGRAGKEMIPILNQGGEAMREAKAKAIEYGAAYTALSDDAQTKGVALAESINETGVAWAGVTNVLGSAFGPALKEITDSINSLVKAFVDSYTEGGTVAVVFETIKTVIEEVGAVVNAFAGVFYALWEAVTAIVADVASAILDAFGIKTPGAFKTADAALNLFKDAFIILKDVIVGLIQVIKIAIMGMIDALVLMGKIALDAFSMNWSAIAADWQTGLDRLKAHATKNAADIKATYQDLAKTIAAALNGEVPTGGETGIKEGDGRRGGGFDPELAKEKKPKKEKAAKDDLVQELEAVLTAKKLAWSMEQDAARTAHAFSLQEESDYWKSILERTDLSVKDRGQIETKYLAVHSQILKQRWADEEASYRTSLDLADRNEQAKLELVRAHTAEVGRFFGSESTEFKRAKEEEVREERKAADEIETIDRIHRERQAAFANDRIEESRRVAAFRVQMGVESNAELLADDRRAAAAEHLITMSKLADSKAAAIRVDDKTELAKITAQQAAARQAYQNKLTDIDRKAILERTKLERAGITSTASLWGQNIAKLITLQQGFSATLHNLYTGMVSIVSNALASILEQWLAKHIATLILGNAASKVSGTAEIATAAAIAGANGVASFAAAPWPIDLGAPAFGASMAAAAAAFSGGLAVPGFAVGAWDLSKDQLAMVHSGEMIIPANIAGGMRNMLTAATSPAANNNSPAAANDSINAGDHFHYHDSTGTMTPGAIMANRHALAKAMRQAYREGSPRPK